MKKLVFVIMFVFTSPIAIAQEQLRVVASVKPLQLVANAIVADLGDVDVLIPPGGSPHHYALKPSGIRALRDADLVIWVGPELEQFLAKTLRQVDVPLLQLMKSDVEEHHDEPVDHDAHSDNAGHEEHHHHGESDPHVWMDPLLMLEAGEQIKLALSARKPEYAAQLEINFQRFADRLLKSEQQVRKQLLPYQDNGFVVFHDAFALFVEHYGLHQKAYFTVDPARAPGAKKLASIQGLLESSEVGCVFIEPQFKAAVIKQIVSDLPVKLGRLDPLAIDITLEQGYSGYLEQLGDNIEACLQ